jgi:hypothetical protein
MPSFKAVVCGINEYGSPQNNLPSCVSDARAIARLLQEQYGCSDVHVVLDREATVANIEKELEWLVRDASPGDRLVFYYSGHGFTKMVGEVMREFLVLVDETGKPALWEDDRLVEITRKTPSGCDPTVMLDSCYSGGMFKWIFDPTESVAEAAKIKVYQPPPEELQKDFTLPESSADSGTRRRVTAYRQFGRSSNTSTAAVAKAFGAETSSSWASPAAASKAVSDQSEEAQPELKGLLISACLETETAAASTSRTNGLSAFTCALLQVMADGAKGKSARNVFDETAARLSTLGFRQTPTCASGENGNLANCTFITMEDRTMTATTVPVGVTPGASGDAERDVQKRVLEGILTMLPTLVNIIGAQQKAAALDEEEPAPDESGDGADEVLDKSAVGLFRSLLPVALRIAQSVQRKEVKVDDQIARSADPGGEEMQKFLPALMTIAAIAPKIPGAVNMMRDLVSPKRGARPRRKDLRLDGGDDETEKSLRAVISMLVAAAPDLARALEPNSSH